MGVQVCDLHVGMRGVRARPGLSTLPMKEFVAAPRKLSPARRYGTDELFYWYAPRARDNLTWA